MSGEEQNKVLQQIHADDLERLTGQWTDQTNHVAYVIEEAMKRAQDQAYACGYRRGAEAKKAIEQQREQLINQLAKHQRQAAIGLAIERACAELPDGWDLELALERGAATVRLFIPEHDTYLEDFGEDNTMAEQLDNAINVAIAKGGAA